MSQISRATRAAVLSRLAASFNTNLATAIGTGAYGAAVAYTIDWSVSSRQLFQANVGPDDADVSSPDKYPLVMIYSPGTDDTNLQSRMLFSGPAPLIVEFHLSWSVESVPPSEDQADAIQDAMFETINGTLLSGTGWPSPLAYNNNMTERRSAVTMSGENWRQTVRFTLAFDVHTN